MALGAQLGGFTTLIGAGTNLIASDALAQAGYAPFNFFSYTPVGLSSSSGGASSWQWPARRSSPRECPRQPGSPSGGRGSGAR